MQYDALSFDEFTIIPEKWWSLLLELKVRKPTIRMRFFGDPQQLHSNDYGNKKIRAGLLGCGSTTPVRI